MSPGAGSIALVWILSGQPEDRVPQSACFGWHIVLYTSLKGFHCCPLPVAIFSKSVWASEPPHQVLWLVPVPLIFFHCPQLPWNAGPGIKT